MNFKNNSTQIQNNKNNLVNQSSQNNIGANPISVAKLIQDNETLSLALKQEIMKNEEQEKYIQSLKETIESNLYNCGFGEILASSKEYEQFQEYNKGQGKTMADFVVDFIKFKEETNNNKGSKTNINKNKDDLINKLKKDINLLEVENNNLKNKINTLENGNNGLSSSNAYENISENINQNVINYEQEYKDLLIEYEKLKSEKKNNNEIDTIEEIHKLKSIINDREREIQDLYDNLNMVSNNESMINIENRNNKQKLQDCNLCIDKLQFEKSTLSEEFCNLQQKYDELINMFDKSQNDYKLLNINFDKLKKEYNILLDEKMRQEKELQNHLNIKYTKDLEINDMENKFNEDMNNIQNKNKQLSDKLDRAKMKIDELNDNILNLKEINELTNKQLREKIENEQIILKENLNYKNAIEEINLQNNENNKNLKKELNTYKELTKTYNTIKSENLDLQKKINESARENTKLIDTNNKILEEKKNFDEKYKVVLNKLQSLKNFDIQVESFDEFLQKISDEIIKLNRQNEKLNGDIKTLNLKCFEMAKENENIIQENTEIKNILNKLKNEYDNELKEKEDLINQIDKCKMMNYQLQKTLDDYGTELNNKINDLNNLSYEKAEIENNNIKLNNEKQDLLTLLIRVTKLFSLSNIYELIQNIFNKGNITNNQNDFNEKLVEELQRCQEYVNMLKENDLQTHLLNIKLDKEIQDFNPTSEKKEKRNISTKKSETINTLDNNNYFLDYRNKSNNNKIITESI
jgi:N-terminal acetyltransferase B complex non-catalytic subunit